MARENPNGPCVEKGLKLAEMKQKVMRKKGGCENSGKEKVEKVVTFRSLHRWNQTDE